MSSLPNQTHLSVTPNNRRHKHKRSAAISGDFDAMGLGLFAPKPTPAQHSTHSPHSSNIDHIGHMYTSSHGNSESFNNFDKESDSDPHYNFNSFDNYEDFTNKPVSDDFAFPSKAQDFVRSVPKTIGDYKTLGSSSPRPTFAPMSPTSARKNFHSSSHSLNSPIKINQHKRSATTANTTNNKTRFFLTEDATFNNENIPDAVIDLDEILNANLHIGYNSPNLSANNSANNSNGSLPTSAQLAQNSSSNLAPSLTPTHTPNMAQNLTPNLPLSLAHSAPDYDDDFLASPFVKHNSSPFTSSPLYHQTQNNYTFYSAPNSLTVGGNFLFNQPIQEQSGDMIEEEEDATPSNELYTNLSANSSCSSIRSVAKIPLIEKTFSNSSRDSASSLHAPYLTTTGILTSATPTGKRSGAKANRYQTFYDQSSRISNAMKISSSDSVNIIRSNSSGTNIVGTPIPNSKDRSLGHSSSLPSLKSNTQKRIISFQHRQRFSNTSGEYKRVASPPMHSLSQEKFNSSSSLNSLNSKENETEATHEDVTAEEVELAKNVTELRLKEPFDNVTAELAHIVLDTPTITLTPTTSHAPCTMKAIIKTSSSTSPVSVHSDVSSAVISSNETVQSTDHSSLASQHDSILGKSKKHDDSGRQVVNDSTLNQSKSKLDRSASSTPAIVINSGSCYDGTSSPSTNSTFKQDDDDQKSQILNESTLLTSQNQDLTLDLGEKDCGIVSPIPLHAVNILSEPSSGKSSNKSSPKKSPRRMMTPGEERILKMTMIPSFKLSSSAASSSGASSSMASSLVSFPAVSSSTPDIGNSPVTSKFPVSESRSVRSTSEKQMGTPEPEKSSDFAHSSPTFFGRKKRSAANNNQTQKRNLHEQTAIPPQEQASLPLLLVSPPPTFSNPFQSELPSHMPGKTRRSSTFTLLQRESEGVHQRRGSAFSIASSPVNMAPTQSPSQSLGSSRRTRHSKNKSFSLSMHDLAPRFSKLSGEQREQRDQRDPEKKTTKFISWFRKK